MQQTYDMDYGKVDDELIEEYNQDLRGLVSDVAALRDMQVQVNTMITTQADGATCYFFFELDLIIT